MYYEPSDVLAIARNRLCKEFPDKNLQPVGSGGGRLWINLPGESKLYLYYPDKATYNYTLICPNSNHPLIPDVLKSLLTKKVIISNNPLSVASLEIIVKANHGRNFVEEHLDDMVKQVVNAGKQILESYFEVYKSTDLKPQQK